MQLVEPRDTNGGHRLVYCSAVSLDIVWKDSPYWKVVKDPAAFFGTTMLVDGVSWFDVRGELSTALQSGKAYTAAWRIAVADMFRTGELSFITTVEGLGSKKSREFRTTADPFVLLQNVNLSEERYFELEVATFWVDQEGAAKDLASLKAVQGNDGAAVMVNITCAIVNHDCTVTKFGLRLDSLVLRHTSPGE